ncbi:MAG: glycoside hydrolase family 88 protein [Treponemataceae bacterium]|nr:glycoside hydrolase family 88 protein [Treponemataceae bacterium]
MAYYFDDAAAVCNLNNSDIKDTLNCISSTYMYKNPAKAYIARPFLNTGIRRGKDYRYCADLNALYPDAENGAYVYMRGVYASASNSSIQFTVIPYGPVKIWMNGKEVFASDIFTERYADKAVTFSIPVKKGRNSILLRCTKTKSGFGAEFGTWLGKLDYRFYSGMKGCSEYEGIDLTLPSKEKNTALETDCSAGQSLADKNKDFFLAPAQWTDDEVKKGNFGRIFGTQAVFGRGVAAAVSYIRPLAGDYRVECKYEGSFSLFVSGKKVLSGEGSGKLSSDIKLSGKKYLVEIVSECPDPTQGKWACDVAFIGLNGQKVAFESVFFDERTPESAAAFPWAYTGLFSEAKYIPFNRSSLACIGNECRWYQLDKPHCWVRLYNENNLFGHWNYPLGVTLYGLVELGRKLSVGSEEDVKKGARIKNYVKAHVSQSVASFDYARFDKAMFGGATGVHHLLTSIDSLDDCGSFGSLMLETSKDLDIGEYHKIADYVGEYIVNCQDRLPDGAFFRKEMMHHFHNGTMWADDLYMSIPFLCRYAKYTGKMTILDDAVSQFEGFKKRLFMEENGLMAHVYDFNRDMNTGVPWGRGNGWTVFSLTELLQVLPENHPKREFLLSFYRTLCKAYLSCQDEKGMWHQVLNMKESYPETSCTAMFISAFARGLRNGWLTEDTEKYREACEKAWKALTRISIDVKGNVYGVCRGSEFAFNPRYYAEHLLPRLNDTHGIGIVILAGVELLRLQASD